MKKYYIILSLFSLSAHAQWDFLVETNGVLIGSSQIIYPINYSENSCQFTFDVINESQIDNVIIDNSQQCGQYNWVVIDGYQYQIPAGFTFTFDSNDYSFSDVLDMGACSTSSGDPILTGTPQLQLGVNNFQYEPTKTNKVFIESNHTFFQFNSANGDLICTNGLLFELPVDFIFRGAFE